MEQSKVHLCLPRPHMFHFHQLFSLEVPLQHRTLEKARKDLRKTQTKEKTFQDQHRLPAVVPGTKLCWIVSAGTKSGPRSGGGRSSMDGKLGGGGGGRDWIGVSTPCFWWWYVGC